MALIQVTGSGKIMLLNGKVRLLSATAVSVPAPTPAPAPAPAPSAAPPVGSGAIDSYRVHRRTATTGNPAGFSTTYGKGWGPVTLKVVPSSNTTAQLSIRLRDASNPGTYAAPGAIVQNWITVPGGPYALTTAGTPIQIDIPASTTFYIADIALSSDLTTGVTVTNPFGVGYVFFAMGPSLIQTWFNDYAYYSNSGISFAGISAVSPNGVMFYQARLDGQTINAPGGNTWFTPVDTYGTPGHSTFATDFLRLTSNQLGVVTAMCGWAHNGVNFLGLDAMADDSDWQGNILPILQHLDGQFDALFLAAGQSNEITTFSMGDVAARIGEMLDVFAAKAGRNDFKVLTGLLPGCVTQIGFPGTFFTPMMGYVQAAARYPNAEFWDGGEDEYYPQVSHTSWRGRQREGQSVYRRLMASAGQFAGDGPTMVSAMRAAGSTDIIVTYQHHGGSNLVAFAHTDNAYMTDTINATPSAALLAQDFLLFPPGTSTTQPAFDATIISPTQVRLRLASLPADSVGFDLWRGQPQTNVIPAGGIPSLRDDYVNGDGIAQGRRQRGPAGVLWPLYVAPPSAPAQTIAVTGISGYSGTPAVASGAFIRLSGTFAGPVAASTIDVQFDGGAFVTVPIWLCVILNSGTWMAAIQAPGDVASHTVTARLTGTTTNSSAFSFSTVAMDLPISSGAQSAVTLDVDPRRTSLFFADTARTSPAGDGTNVFSMTDATGHGNHMTNPNTVGLRLAYGYQSGLPALHGSRIVGANMQFNLPGTTQRILQTITGSPLAAGMRGSFTVFAVFSNRGGSDTAFSMDIDGSGQQQSPQTLRFGGGGTYVFVERNGTNGNTITINDGKNADNSNKVAPGFVRRVAIRFDPSTGTLRLKQSPGTASATATTAESVSIVSGDYTTGAAWQHGTLARFVSSLQNFNYNFNWAGGIDRLVFLPGYVASDADTDAMLGHLDGLYGSY